MSHRNRPVLLSLAEAIKSIEFARAAFNVEAKWEDRPARYRQATEVRSREFEGHFDDVVLKGDKPETA